MDKNFHLCPNGEISQKSPSCPVVHRAWKGMWKKWKFCTCPMIDNENVDHGILYRLEIVWMMGISYLGVFPKGYYKL